MMEPYDSRPCALGEGPLWHPERRQLFWFDILGHRLLSREGDRPLSWQFDECVSAAGWIDRETLLIASETALWRFDIGTGTRLRLVALEEGNRVTRSNDGRADPQGGFWIGTMGKSAEARAGAIYRYHRGALRRLYADLTIPNAISFAPDGRSACFADTRQQRIFRVALDAEGWPCDEPQVLVDLAPEGLFPDGAVFDRDGGLWNAQWGAGRVARYRPDGTFDRAIAVPARQSSCPAFGGDGLGTLFVTSAAVDIAGADTAQGCVYAVAAGVTGMAEHRFRT
ncbi:MAG: SMP-30/gluconolactonase/LRE family protein [Rhodobacteraceae bacterium]|nr:SMP-30/gluconolactonase/LRE family protein [Paracoccaceae bacterium]